MPLDPHPASAAAATATAAPARPFTNPQPRPNQLYSPQQQPYYTASPHPIPIRTNAKPHDASQGVLYPVASSGRGFIPKSLRPDQYPPRPVSSYPHQQVRPIGSPHVDSLKHHPAHIMRHPQFHNLQIGNAGAPATFPIKGIPVSAQPRVVLHPSSVSDCNGYKNLRDRGRDDSSVVVRDRKVVSDVYWTQGHTTTWVRKTDGASLYALCRSWLRNGYPEESQPQCGDVVKPLPRPLPIPTVDAHLPNKKEGEEDKKDDEKEDEESVEHLSAQDLLKRHVKRAKNVRERLRKERLQRIARYKTRLALLLPPFTEQYRNDPAAGN